MVKLSECDRCVLHKHRTQVVKGRGNKKALLMWIGEAPGAKEDEFGIPFWPYAPAGKFLTKMVGYSGFSRDEVWITNINKCRPKDNRTPIPTEIWACVPWIRKELNIIRPGVVVTLGANALKAIIKSSKISEYRGRFLFLPGYLPKNGNKDQQGIYIVAMYHPAAICYGSRERRNQIKENNIQDSRMIHDYFFNRILPKVEVL